MNAKVLSLIKVSAKKAMQDYQLLIDAVLLVVIFNYCNAMPL